MRNIEQLKAVFKKQLPIKSNRRHGGNGISYTERELNCVRFLARLIFTVNDIECTEPVSNEELEEIPDKNLLYRLFFELKNQRDFTDVPSAIRHTYKVFEIMMLEDEETLDDFPLVDGHGRRIPRNQSSHTVMFRTAIRGLVSSEILDIMFNISHKKNS